MKIFGFGLRRYSFSLMPHRLDNIVQNMKTNTSNKDCLKVLDYVYAHRLKIYQQFLKPSVTQQLINKVDEVISQNPGDAYTSVIYDVMCSLKCIGNPSRNLYALKINELIQNTKNPGLYCETLFSYMNAFPYHSEELGESISAIKLHDYHQAIIKRVSNNSKNATWKDLLDFYRSCYLLKFWGFDATLEKAPTITRLLVNQVPIKQLYDLGLVLADFPDGNESHLETVINRLLQSDGVEYDRYLHRVEFIDLDQKDEMTLDTFDVINWKELGILSRIAVGCVQNKDKDSRINQIFWRQKIHKYSLICFTILLRKLEAQELDIYYSPAVLSHQRISEAQDSKAVFQRILESISSVDFEEAQHAPLGLVRELLRIGKDNNVNPSVFKVLLNNLPLNKTVSDEEQIQNFIQELKGKEDQSYYSVLFK